MSGPAERVGHLTDNGDSRTWTPSAGDVVLLQLLLTLGYALALIIALDAPDTRLAVWMNHWVRGTRPALTPFYALAGHPSCGGAAAGPHVMQLWDYYIHLLAVSLIVAVLCIVVSAALWKDWAERLQARMSASRVWRGRMRRTVQLGWSRLAWGALAVFWLLILGNDIFDSAARCARLNPWLLLRIPLLAALAQGFASAAATFWTARAIREEPRS